MARERVPGTDAPRTARPNADRPHWWRELPLIAVVYACYSLARLLVRGGESIAVDHGLAILDLEKSLHLNAEHPLNRLFTGQAWIGIPADFAYASLHYVVTPAILVWLFRRRPTRYRAARTWLMVATMLGLIGFTLFPTCPPRLLDASHGFVDTMAHYSAYGWWGAEASAPRGLGGMTNQFAAMPSLHVGWAVWCGVMLWRYGRTPLLRAIGVAYPLLTALVVMGTANHYFLDAVAGVAVMAAGALLTRPVLRLTRPVLRLAHRAKSRFATATSAARTPVVSAGCETSAGERIPHQRGAGDGLADPESPSGADRPADDSAAATAR